MTTCGAGWAWAGCLSAALLIAGCGHPALAGEGDADSTSGHLTYRDQVEILTRGAFENNVQVDHEALRAAFETAFGPVAQLTADTVEQSRLPAMTDALYMLNFYSPRAMYATRLLELFQALDHHTDNDHPAASGDSSPPSAQQVYNSLIIARTFSEAADFAAGNPAVVPVQWPETLDRPSPTGPAIVRFEEADGGFHARIATVEIRNEPIILAAVHPHCGFSRRAMDHIVTDAELRALFERHSMWIARQGDADITPLLEWNRGHGHIEIAQVWQEPAWPADITFGLTPVFYFLSRGQIEEIVVGWPGDEQAQALHAAWKKITTPDAG